MSKLGFIGEAWAKDNYGKSLQKSGDELYLLFNLKIL